MGSLGLFRYPVTSLSDFHCQPSLPILNKPIPFPLNTLDALIALALPLVGWVELVPGGHKLALAVGEIEAVGVFHSQGDNIFCLCGGWGNGVGGDRMCLAGLLHFEKGFPDGFVTCG